MKVERSGVSSRPWCVRDDEGNEVDFVTTVVIGGNAVRTGKRFFRTKRDATEAITLALAAERERLEASREEILERAGVTG